MNFLGVQIGKAWKHTIALKYLLFIFYDLNGMEKKDVHIFNFFFFAEWESNWILHCSLVGKSQWCQYWLHHFFPWNSVYCSSVKHCEFHIFIIFNVSYMCTWKLISLIPFNKSGKCNDYVYPLGWTQFRDRYSLE